MRHTDKQKLCNYYFFLILDFFFCKEAPVAADEKKNVAEEVAEKKDEVAFFSFRFQHKSKCDSLCVMALVRMLMVIVIRRHKNRDAESCACRVIIAIRWVLKAWCHLIC